jgi:hypothetical protein
MSCLLCHGWSNVLRLLRAGDLKRRLNRGRIEFPIDTSEIPALHISDTFMIPSCYSGRYREQWHRVPVVLLYVCCLRLWHRPCSHSHSLLGKLCLRPWILISCGRTQGVSIARYWRAQLSLIEVRRRHEVFLPPCSLAELLLLLQRARVCGWQVEFASAIAADDLPQGTSGELFVYWQLWWKSCRGMSSGKSV